MIQMLGTGVRTSRSFGLRRATRRFQTLHPYLRSFRWIRIFAAARRPGVPTIDLTFDTLEHMLYMEGVLVLIVSIGSYTLSAIGVNT
jgi:hypothetical protein